MFPVPPSLFPVAFHPSLYFLTIFCSAMAVNKLANNQRFDFKDFNVVDEPNPPSKLNQIFLVILGILGLLRVGYFLIN